MSNLRSLCPKIDRNSRVRQGCADIVSVTKTWPTQNTPDYVVLIIDFTIFRNDRSDGPGDGGMASYVKSNIPSKMLSDAERYDTVWVALSAAGLKDPFAYPGLCYLSSLGLYTTLPQQRTKTTVVQLYNHIQG